MNKKQLIVAWMMVILTSLICVAIFYVIGPIHRNSILVKYGIEPPSQAILIKVILKGILLIVPAFLTGGLLIYTLRDKKK